MSEIENGTRLDVESKPSENGAVTQGGGQEMKELMHSIKECVMDSVERKPYQMLAIAAGVGFLAGMLLKRR
ncbi:MAG: DUF883 C-terminal domain-containing protein [Phycisphaerales bacterium]|nr:DUF883 C-terminal domain-containing protein [Phycisphaerales bacterium]